MVKLTTVYDFLKNVDMVDTGIAVYLWEDGNDADPVYAGSAFNTPYWVAELRLDWIHEEKECPIVFIHDLGEKCNHKPGFCIYCTGECL